MNNEIAATRVIEFFKRERWAALLLPDGWCGGPMGALHQLSGLDFHEDGLTVGLDRVQELRFFGRVTTRETSSRLIFEGYTRMQFDWPPRSAWHLGLFREYGVSAVEFVTYSELQSRDVQPPAFDQAQLIDLVHTCGDFDEGWWQALDDTIRAGEEQIALENWIGQLYEFELPVGAVPLDKLRSALRQFGVDDYYLEMFQELLV